MKKTISLLGGLVLILLSASLYAQDTNATANRWDASKNPTVDSITAPFRGKMLPPRPVLTQADIFPVVGKYTSTTSTEAPNVTIVLDEQNKGLVWIDGLPQGRIKAYLRQSPSTYKIPVQKTADDKDVAEGTLIFDKTSGNLNLVIGKTYNAEDPSSAFMIATDENGAAVANDGDKTVATDANTDKAVTDVDNANKDKAADQDKMVTDHEKKVVLKDKNTKTKTKVKTKKVEEPKPWTWSGTKVDATASAQ